MATLHQTTVTMSACFRTFLIGMLLAVGLYHSPALYAVNEEHPILIVSSYNPGAYPASSNVSEFMDEYKALGGKHNVIIENMNCKSFSDSPRWKGVMKEILDKYNGKQEPTLIVLLGQEAWAAYLSQDDSVKRTVPVITLLSSRNLVTLPDEGTDLKSWMPESVDFFEDRLDDRTWGGFVYEYDIEANVRLIQSVYPKTKHIAFLTDNSYGGVTLQALAREKMKKFPELDLILLDGRVNTIYTIVDRFRELPEYTVVLLGTWRVDMNDGYFMRNATYAMMEANPDVPVFTASSIGLGYWAIGGVIPAFRSFGKEVAQEVVRLLNNREDKVDIEVEVVDCRTVMDSRKVKELAIDVESLPMKVEIVNRPPSFYEQYRYQIWLAIAILAILVGGLLVSLYYYFRMKRLKDDLERSEVDLREAKDRAEESNRLKSAFLANMSHEIRTPLNAIVGFSDVLAMGGATEEEHRNFFEIIKANSDLLLRLINDILDISRLESGKVQLTYETIDVVQLARHALTSVEFSRKSLTNRFVFTSGVDSFMLRTDTQRMQQVMINLLSNADKFTKEGTITLDFRVDAGKKMALFSVTDTGCGIPKEKHKLVFERFEKLNEYAQGTGLGLAICRLIVLKWGGDIWVDPDYEDGARFVFSHPVE